MRKKRILVDDVAREWMKDPAFVKAYDDLEEEFMLAKAPMRARGDMTQEEPARGGLFTTPRVSTLSPTFTFPLEQRRRR